ncbi:MAG TPA: hypothetical protein VMW53_00745 [archaeon]|nr:hypothetical protein [archaeon]
MSSDSSGIPQKDYKGGWKIAIIPEESESLGSRSNRLWRRGSERLTGSSHTAFGFCHINYYESCTAEVRNHTSLESEQKKAIHGDIPVRG